MQRWFLIGTALAVGALLPLQSGINAQLRQFVGSPFRSALFSVAVSALTLGLVLLLRLAPIEGPVSFSNAPWWVFIGGVLGVGILSGSLILAPRLGAASLTAGVICGQLITSLLLDHWGLVGYKIVPLSPARIGGAVLLLLALYLIQQG